MAWRAVLIAGALGLLAALSHSPHALAQGVMQMANTPSDLKKFNVTVRRFDPAKGLASGTDFVLPVDSRTRSMRSPPRCPTRWHSPTRSTAAACCPWRSPA